MNALDCKIVKLGKTKKKTWEGKVFYVRDAVVDCYGRTTYHTLVGKTKEEIKKYKLGDIIQS